MFSLGLSQACYQMITQEQQNMKIVSLWEIIQIKKYTYKEKKIVIVIKNNVLKWNYPENIV